MENEKINELTELAAEYKKLEARRSCLADIEREIKIKKFDIRQQYETIIEPAIQTLEVRMEWSIAWQVFDPECGRQVVLMCEDTDVLKEVAEQNHIDLQVIPLAMLEDKLEQRVKKSYNLRKLVKKQIEEFDYDREEDEFVVIIEFNKDGSATIIIPMKSLRIEL